MPCHLFQKQTELLSFFFTRFTNVSQLVILMYKNIIMISMFNQAVTQSRICNTKISVHFYIYYFLLYQTEID